MITVSYKMSFAYTKSSLKHSLLLSTLLLLLFGNSAFAALFEYKADLFGPGMNFHNCVHLDSRGTILADYDATERSVSNIRGELDFVTITAGFIQHGFNNIRNFVLGTFNDNAPPDLRDKNIFVDLSRGADYERTIVNDRRIREWGWALFYDPADYEEFVTVETLSEALFADRDDLRTIFNPYKTFGELCPQYAGSNSSGANGWCSAGVEFFANKGKPVPAPPVPLPAAFYFMSAGLIGLFSVTRKRSKA